MTVLTVGLGKQFSTIAGAVAAAQNGDTIDVDAGTYTNDFPVNINKSLTLEAVGGRVEMVATVSPPNGKAIINIEGGNPATTNVSISGFDFRGAQVPDGNGAGIKDTVGNLTLNNDGFFNNQNGLLTGNDGTDTIVITNSEFANNGNPSDGGQTHNIYIGHVASATLDNVYVHGVANQGHEIKSRALSTTITNSRVYDLNSTASLSIDLPNGGNALIQNNVIEQGPNSSNHKIIDYGEEGNLNPGTNFVISGNTILNDEPVNPLVLYNTTTTTAQFINNKFFGVTAGQIAFGPNTQSGDQFLITEPALDTTHPWASQIVLSIGLASDTGVSATDRITSNPAITGSGEANTAVTIKEGTTTLGTTMADSTGAWSFAPSGLAQGAHTLVASETDAVGNTGTATLSFILDTTAPVVSMALASDTGVSATDRITSNPAITGSGEANTAVTIKEGTTTLGTTMADSTGAWSFAPSGLAQGAHTLVASETDAAGNTGTATLSFILDTTAPVVSMALASDTGVSATDRITSNPAITGSGEANTAVTIKEGTTTLGTTMADSTGAWSFAPSGLADGTHMLIALQSDVAGNTGGTIQIFKLDRTPPAVTIALISDTGVSATDRITSNPAIHGFGDAGTAVTITEGSTTLGTTMADVAGAWSFTPTGLGDGAHTLTATETDLAGNTGSAALSFTLDTHGMTGVA